MLPSAINLYGLSILSPFCIPQLPLLPRQSQCDVIIKIGAVPASLDTPLANEDNWQANNNQYLYDGGNSVGRFLVNGSNSIIYEPTASPDLSKLAYHLSHALICAVMRHRGDLVLHASSVELNGTTISISGKSGAGKSTTTAELLARGARLIADDITVLRADPEGRPFLQPGLPFLHLANEALKATTLEGVGELSPVRRDKCIVPCEMTTSRSCPLDVLVLLEVADPTGSGGKLHVSRCKGGEAFRVLQHCIYGPLLPIDIPRVFPLQSKVARTARVCRIVRPAGHWTLEAVVEEIAGLPLSS